MGSGSQERQQQQKPPLFFSLDDFLSKADGNCHFADPLLPSKLTKLEHREHESRLCSSGGWKQTSVLFAGTRTTSPRRRRPTRVLFMKRKPASRIDRRRRRATAARPASNLQMERRVRILKKLIPANSGESGLDNLFRETADYILALQLRVKVMQVMVDVLSAGSD